MPLESPHAYLSRLLVHHAPWCEPLPDLYGVCTQIDNLLVGLTKAKCRHESFDRGRCIFCGVGARSIEVMDSAALTCPGCGGPRQQCAELEERLGFACGDVEAAGSPTEATHDGQTKETA